MATRLEVLEKMAAKTVSDPFPLYGLALEYRSGGREEDALKTFTTLREKFPHYVPQYLMAGQLCEKLGKRDEAKDWFASGVSIAEQVRDMHALGELQSALAAHR